MPRRSKYDEFFFRNTGEVATCRICEARVPWSRFGGTNCVRLHLSTRHNEEFLRMEPEGLTPKRVKNPKRKSSSPGDSPVDNGSSGSDGPNGIDLVVKEETPEAPDVSQLDNSLVSWICKDRIPLSAIEGAGFRQFMSTVAPNYTIQPIETYAAVNLPAIKFQIECQIQSELFRANGLSLVCHKNDALEQGKQQISVYAHWLDKETLKPKEALLAVRTIPDEPSATLELIFDTIGNYSISKKLIIGLLHDDEEVRKMLSERDGAECLFSFTNMLQEIIEKGIVDPKLGLPISRMKRKVLPYGDEREEKVPWKMMYDEITNVIDSESEIYNQFSGEDWNVFYALQRIFKEINETISSVKTGNMMTASVTIPVLRVLTFKLDSMGRDGITTHEMMVAKQFTPCFNSKLDQCQNHMILKTATFLDPRFKDSYFKTSHISFMVNNFSEDVAKSAEDKEKGIVKEEFALPTPLSSFELFLQSNSQQKTPVPKMDRLAKEIQEYLVNSPDFKIDPLEFWKSNRTTFPKLFKLAVQYFSIPASASPPATPLVPDRNKHSISEILNNLEYCTANIAEYYPH